MFSLSLVPGTVAKGKEEVGVGCIGSHFVTNELGVDGGGDREDRDDKRDEAAAAEVMRCLSLCSNVYSELRSIPRGMVKALAGAQITVSGHPGYPVRHLAVLGTWKLCNKMRLENAGQEPSFRSGLLHHDGYLRGHR